MKISALKKMVREAVRAEMKAMEKRLAEQFAEQLNEALQGPSTPPLTETPTCPAPSGLSELRQRFRAAQQDAAKFADDPGYTGIEGGGVPSPAAGGPRPNNPTEVTKEGVKYTSGKNLLDWYKQDKDEEALNEHEKALARGEKIDNYVQDIVGKRRI